jgi:AcrR family transcriptional regulator
MYKLCKTESAARRQRQLEDGLLSAMLSQRYEDIAISDLCDQLSIPRKSFYRYFASKDGALHALIDHRLLECEMQNMGSGERGESTLNIPHFFLFWMNRKPLLPSGWMPTVSEVRTPNRY